jgi:hypothetical protein
MVGIGHLDAGPKRSARRHGGRDLGKLPSFAYAYVTHEPHFSMFAEVWWDLILVYCMDVQLSIYRSAPRYGPTVYEYGIRTTSPPSEGTNEPMVSTYKYPLTVLPS